MNKVNKPTNQGLFDTVVEILRNRVNYLTIWTIICMNIILWNYQITSLIVISNWILVVVREYT